MKTRQPRRTKSGRSSAAAKRSGSRASRNRKAKPLTAEPAHACPVSGYRCPSCGCTDAIPPPDWESAELRASPPTIGELESPWMLCPMDSGPDSGLLTHPSGKWQRERVTLNLDGHLVRVCTPFALLPDRPSGLLVPQTLLNELELAAEAHSALWGQSHRPDDIMDLEHLKIVGEAAHASLITQVGPHYLLDQRGPRPNRPYYRSLWQLYRNCLRQIGYTTDDLVSLIRCLDPRAAPSLDNSRHTLYVPIDLAMPLEEQFAELALRADSMARYLRRFVRRPQATPPRKFLYRDLLILLLHDVLGITPTDIARRVFGPSKARLTISEKKDLRRAAKSVSKIVAETRKDIKAAGWKEPEGCLLLPDSQK